VLHLWNLLSRTGFGTLFCPEVTMEEMKQEEETLAEKCQYFERQGH
jgi:hypothetical protein